MATHHIHPTATLGDLPESTLQALTASLTALTIENDLRRKVVDNIKRLRDIGTVRGRRHDMGLPVRGQRTRTQVRLQELRSTCNLFLSEGRASQTPMLTLINLDYDISETQPRRKKRLTLPEFSF